MTSESSEQQQGTIKEGSWPRASNLKPTTPQKQNESNAKRQAKPSKDK